MIGAALSFVTSRLGMVAVVFVAGYLIGYGAASKGAAVSALRAENAALRSDLAMNEAAARLADAEAEQLRALHGQLQEEIDAYLQDIASRQDGDACRLTDGDVERLRGLVR